MSFLFIGSTGDHAGQSLVAWAIARRLLEKGLNLGVLKPFGTRLIQVNEVWTDPDASLFREVLNIEEPLERICPFTVSEKLERQGGPKEIINRIKSLASELSRGRDILLILGSKHIFFDDNPYSLPDTTVISELDADMALVHRHRKVSTSIYSILSVNSLLRARFKGIIINRVQREDMGDIREKIVPVLCEQGISEVAVLPEDPFLSLWSLREITEMLKGRVICCGEFLDRPVEGMTVGTADLQGELLIFKRVYNKIILLGPSADARSIAGILLTGNREPAQQVLEAARRSGVPLISVREDSFTAKEMLEMSTPTITPADEDKVLHFTAMMDRDDSLNRLLGSAGLV